VARYALVASTARGAIVLSGFRCQARKVPTRKPAPCTETGIASVGTGSLDVVRFSLVTLFVEDPISTARWYREHLGLAVQEQTDRFVRLADEDGRACLALHVGPPLKGADHVQLHFEVDDVDARYQALAAKGVPFDSPPTDKQWGWRVATTKDPAGHTVELVRASGQRSEGPSE
jgi:catechol 2,3-dioxygenase-like lactoylglutathione lyase family enzyme